MHIRRGEDYWILDPFFLIEQLYFFTNYSLILERLTYPLENSIKPDKDKDQYKDLPKIVDWLVQCFFKILHDIFTTLNFSILLAVAPQTYK